ncbi:prolipoprotein diacylglyceryl transferase [Meridianimarinicoccus roseus]|uniref:Phosphatidylglycerol--prolipoprotein diacylglyceryl transferase n=1 Tax=Meridianimarinicoccus roseus TaxID=2072018 RepID=A0A2V2L9M3_9RHOB|nr:prolipoprotein diacylglyceryl transferase [Meridianimarinicoccus roseus]PWR01932.1 prolipoprotein diacylglyceryl transferase [Meridianimarinicoccus roseus]
MNLAIPFPDIGPTLVAFEIGGLTLALRWYALAYIAGLLIGLWLVRRALARPALWPGGAAPMTREQAESLLTWVVLGVVIGGRLGFVFLYQPGYYLANPQDIVKVWQGGMAFHGGLAGVIVAGALFCRVHRLPAAQVADAMALATPPGLLLGRIANFINAELWGRPTTLPWGVIFPGEAAQACGPGWPVPCARHPSQLYEAGLEGLVLGTVLLWLVFARGALKVPGQVTGVFLTGYGLARVVVEHFRQADAQFITPDNPWGHVLRLGEAGLTMGQLLSLPMVAAGLLVLSLAWRRGTA